MKPDVPPSYESAISREAWTVIAPWIPSSDLCSACLVSCKWYSIFVPFLWGDPASHFGIENDAVYVALTRFKRSLRKARLSTRGLTHTLHLPPALGEIYGGPHPTWLREVLEHLPNLQSLIVSSLPFFDHHSLVALRSTGINKRSSQGEDNTLPAFGLKLLLASNERNTTSLGLNIAISRFPYLVYLDLSYTTPARDAAVLASLSNLHDLQVLKLRGVGMKDGEAEVLANSIGIRVRLLDLRDNLLTDMAVRSLMQACFLPSDAAFSNSLNVEDWPVGMAPGPDFFSLDALRSEELDHELLKQLTRPLTGRLAFEDIPHRGLTHLYISGNRLSVEGLSSLLKSERLHILDGGTVDTVKTIARTMSPYSETGYIDEVRFPGAEKLIPVLANSASKNLTYLRVDHALVSAKLDTPKEPAKPKGSAVELVGSQSVVPELPTEERSIVEAPAPAHYATELPANDQIFELDATPALPRQELVGDMIYFALSPPVGDKPADSGPDPAEQTSPVKGEGPYAPEVVEDYNHENDTVHDGDPHPAEESEISDDTGTHSTVRSILSPVSPLVSRPSPAHGSFTPLDATLNGQQGSGALLDLAKAAASTHQSSTMSSGPIKQAGLAPAPTTPSSNVQRLARIETLLQKRPTGFPSKSVQPGQPLPKLTAQALRTLHPCLLPNLRTLVLTNVPTSVPKSSTIIEAIKAFVSACADESALSHLLARTDYSLPPGRARHMAEVEHARSLFALRTIILEMEQPGSKQSEAQQRSWQHSRQRLSMSKSSTGDMDSEALWSAAENDFSFFGAEGEEQDECGIYQHDPDKYFPTAHFDDKILLGPDDSGSGVLDSGASSPRGSLHGGYHGTLSPFSMNYGNLKSPRNLPLGRNRRMSGESQRSGISMSHDGTRQVTAEMPGGFTSPDLRQHRLAPRSVPAVAVQDLEPEEEKVDVVAELAAWRKERKKAYDDEVMRQRLARDHSGNGTFNSSTPGNSRSSPSNGPRGYGYGYDDGATSATTQFRAPTSSPQPPTMTARTNGDTDVDMRLIEGHWKGEIKVVRNPTPKGRTGVVDMYGNYFEKGYLYP
ncbi:hypothetical protein PV10_00263 [Exophiala mesophila]|uniref:F-box domain-containing protein n=1 Tax=Exophiala mesophila TaxID=212818 RepID=A0A0D1ZP26_EXOME|nr:uncharacterized protein PV10_00263 [Exophiala mesophila]KIV96382.1 hypothetical protein PV10_00263 [Exophiala mesophila]